MPEHAPRRTKIVATLGPASSNLEMITRLVEAGMDVARLNFSHGSHEDHRRVYHLVREAEHAVGRPVAVLQDLQGPKIRLGKVDGQVRLEVGQQVRLSSANDFLGRADRLPTTYDRLDRDVKPGETLLLADGALELRAIEVDAPDVVCEVVVGGLITSSKGLNMPFSELSIPSVMEKDLEDLGLGLELGVDYVALSFVRHPKEVGFLRHEMDKRGKRVPIIAKIEKPEAVENLEGIVRLSEGIMVARGDLGVELPPERVPGIQRKAIRLARIHGKQTIVATQMLVSMTRSPRPTHAEVSDVANAVFDGADAVMLSEETAAGHDPVAVVRTMASIAEGADAEQVDRPVPDFIGEIRNSHPGAISRAATVMAKEMGADAIAAFTHQGLGPRLLGHFRPGCPILGVTGTAEAARRMALYWGVRPVVVNEPSSIEELVARIEALGQQHGLLEQGSTVVITSKTPFSLNQYTNVLKLHTVGGDRVPGHRPDSVSP